MTIHTKLQTVQDSLRVVDKQGVNAFQKYSYVMLGTILNDLNPLLEANKLAVTQSVESSDANLEFTENCYYSTAHVTLSTTLTDSENGESITIKSSGFAADKNSDKALFKAITGARKYGLTMMFKLHTDSVEPEEDSPELRQSSRKSSPKASVLNNQSFF